MNQTATQTAALIADLWQRSQPLVHYRLQLLDRAAQAVAGQSLTKNLRDEASTVAHNLAGSLGMFGYHEGTTLARRIEFLLDCTAEPDPDEFLRLTRALRQSLASNS